MKAGKAARATQVAPNEVAAARQKTGLSQAQFAKALSGAAQALIQIAFRHPEVIAETLA